MVDGAAAAANRRVRVEEEDEEGEAGVKVSPKKSDARI